MGSAARRPTGAKRYCFGDRREACAWTAAFLVAAALASTSAPAQTVVHSQAGQTTEMRERLADPGNSGLIWNLIGGLG